MPANARALDHGSSLVDRRLRADLVAAGGAVALVVLDSVGARGGFPRPQRQRA